MKIVEKRTLWSEKLRVFCIEEKLYTCGNNEEYYAILNYVDRKSRVKGLSTKDIVFIAKDIKEHSETVYEIPTLCYLINRECSFAFIDTESDD